LVYYVLLAVDVAVFAAAAVVVVVVADYNLHYYCLYCYYYCRVTFCIIAVAHH